MYKRKRNHQKKKAVLSNDEVHVDKKRVFAGETVNDNGDNTDVTMCVELGTTSKWQRVPSIKILS